MKSRLLILTICAAAVGLFPFSIANKAFGAQEPAGTFTVGSSTYHEGESAAFTFGQITGVNRNYEVTLGVWCFLPDGSQIPWGNRANPYIYEFNSFGTVYSGLTVYLGLPVDGTGYSCTARLIAARWFKGTVLQAWTLDEHQFTVLP